MQFSPNRSKQIWWKSEENTESESGVLCAGHFLNMPNHHMSREGIAEWVILYCVEGSGNVICGNHFELTAKPGTVFCLPPDIPHSYAAVPDNPWSIYWMHCYPLLDTELLERLPISAEVGVTPELVGRMKTLLEQMERPPSPLRSAKCRALAQLFLVDILESQPKNSLLEQAKQLLEADFSGNTPIQQIAEQLGLSEYHFIRSFSKYTGMPPNRYRLVLRIRHACGLLQEAGYSVTAVSEQLGYQSPYYFSRQFKQITGYSPKEYARLMKLL